MAISIKELKDYTEAELVAELEYRKSRAQQLQESLKDINPPQTQWPTICSVCGAAATVPFKPTPGWKVKCPACWQKAQEVKNVS